MWTPTPPPFADHKKHVFEKASKVTDFIYQIGDTPTLREPSTLVKDITGATTRAKIAYVKDCLRRYRRLTGLGRAISAVQVGIPERFCVVFDPDPEIDLITIINPKITKTASTKLKYPEICMSANPIIVPLARPAWIEFTYQDEEGRKKHWKTKAETKQEQLLNRVFQHEIDHMDGIINVDKVAHSKDLILESDPEFYTLAEFEDV